MFFKAHQNGIEKFLFCSSGKPQEVGRKKGRKKFMEIELLGVSVENFLFRFPNS